MEIILKEDIKGLGYKNDTVDVKPGYGRNYLIPQGFAIIASVSNRKMIAENIRQAAHKAEKLRQDAQDLANSIGEVVLEIKTKAGESGKIFGAITALQVSDALAVKGFEVDRKRISFEGQVKNVGEYKVSLDLHKEVQHDVTINVVAE
ncbi:50S ribosomal protein L9 [Reichenbachiella carrageenanivorans]|uniref:Large ribosomal subunit protein bL9 n=1 Tax=Reichenbachiella carrageenanivorans TaxID=2979869 RepID=A0ABY6CZE5_9BACT|nr:50S ribosomal protein L9 [Reichenbachiella carrageenanivorans]UXX78750.1 50S ribosomal protein L9 [Reichenbachiella carrageenanivorans]